MEREILRDELQSLLEAIKSAEVVQNRIELLCKIGSSHMHGKSDPLILECLTTLWEDFTCLDVAQCMLNKSILDVATKCLKSDPSRCLALSLILGVKACTWCGKHLKMTLMSSVDSQDEEHCNFYFQFLLELLEFCMACFTSLMNEPALEDKVLRDPCEKFILQNLNLIKDLLSEIKRIHAFSAELLKAAQLLLDAATKLCRLFSQKIIDSCNINDNKDDAILVGEHAARVNHVTNIIRSTIEQFCDLGTIAANGGGSLVTILNVSWKGVVSLLQIGNGKLTEKVDVAHVITILISLAHESLKCAAIAWSACEDVISAGESKRAFLPIKFYVINAVRVCSQYPCQALSACMCILHFILMVSAYVVAASKENNLENVDEALEEQLKPTVLLLLNSLLSSTQISVDQKLCILDVLFSAECCSNNDMEDTISETTKSPLVDLFATTCEALPRGRKLLLGRIGLFMDILKASSVLEEGILHGISQKLPWFLDTLVDADVSSSVLVLQIPAPIGEGKSSAIHWQPMFLSLMDALKTFMILVSSTQAWNMVELFLLENFCHPHFLCREIIMDLWSFVMNHAEEDVVDAFIDKLCSLYKSIASSESLFFGGSALRKVAQSICMLLSCCSRPVADRVYSSIMNDEISHLSLVMHAALLMEGFKLNLLSDDLKNVAWDRILNDYKLFVENFTENSIHPCSSEFVGISVFIISAALRSLQVHSIDINTKTLTFLVAIVQRFRESVDSLVKSKCCRMLGETLGIVSVVKHLSESDEVEQVILELQNMFILGSSAMSWQLCTCKPGLALFLASLGDMEMEESEGNLKCSAVWELYHMLLKERHWALVHLALVAFGYFAGRTTCNQLWRFVPQDAALSYCLESGDDSDEERFMSQLKIFLEKEVALPTYRFSIEQFRLTTEDCMMLNELLEQKSKACIDGVGCEPMDINEENFTNKRQKLPAGFNKGVELLQSGLEIMGDGLSQWQQNHDYDELNDKILTHFSQLEYLIRLLAGLASTG